MPKRTKREHLNNLILVVLNIIVLAVAGFLFEYEIAKDRRPDVGWPATPSEIDYAVAGAIGLGSLAVLAILALIYKKDLYNRPYLWWITGFNLVTGFVMLSIISQQIGLGTLIHFVLFP